MIGLILCLVNLYMIAFIGKGFVEDEGCLSFAAFNEFMIEFCIFLFVGIIKK